MGVIYLVLLVELFLMVMLTLTRLPMTLRGLNFKVQLQGLTLIPLQTLEAPLRRDLLRVVMVLVLIFMKLICSLSSMRIRMRM
ncbi:MAG: hypothetical protein CMN86_00700 [Stappia sp.]|nr:hypothetical protein [Stappia sp.]